MKVMSRRGSPRWPMSDRADHRAEPAGGEDEAEVGRGAAEVVLDDAAARAPRPAP